MPRQSVVPLTSEELKRMGPLLKYGAVARFLDVSKDTVRRYVRNGVLRAIPVGGGRRIEKSELERYLAEQRAKGVIERREKNDKSAPAA